MAKFDTGCKDDSDSEVESMSLDKFLWHTSGAVSEVKCAAVACFRDISFLARSLSGAGEKGRTIPTGQAVVKAGHDIRAGLLKVAGALHSQIGKRQ